MDIFSYLECIASNKKMRLLKAEPPDEVLYEAAKELGVSANDFFYFYVFRPLASSNTSPKIEDIVSSKLKQLSFLGKDFNKSGFLEWYSKNMKKSFSGQSLLSNDFAPLQEGTYIQKLSAKIDRHREIYILDKIEDALNQHADVLVVYSSGHLPKHRKALEDFFGKAVAEGQSVNTHQ